MIDIQKKCALPTALPTSTKKKVGLSKTLRRHFANDDLCLLFITKDGQKHFHEQKEDQLFALSAEEGKGKTVVLLEHGK